MLHLCEHETATAFKKLSSDQRTISLMIVLQDALAGVRIGCQGLDTNPRWLSFSKIDPEPMLRHSFRNVD